MRAPRYEAKLVCEAFDADFVETELRLHPAGIRMLWPRRCVQSIYFDTHEGRALAANFAGISDRSKIRFRWYGEDTQRVAGRLEKKIRKNLFGEKQVLELPEPLDVEGVEREAFTEALRAQCRAEWRHELDGLEPVQWIRYARDYLTTFDHRVRITLDRDITTVDLRDLRRLDGWRRSIPRQVMIVELKAGFEDGDAIREVTQWLPLLVGKSSKFVLASAPGAF